MNPRRAYYKNGQLEREMWLGDGKLHRIDGPAFRRWYENGQLWSEGWRVDGKFHRIDGPAIRWGHKNGQLEREDWYYNGKKYEPEEHPFNVFREEYNLPDTYDKWPTDMKVLFKLKY